MSILCFSEKKRAIIEGDFEKNICLQLSTSDKLRNGKQNCICSDLLHRKYLSLELTKITHEKHVFTHRNFKNTKPGFLKTPPKNDVFFVVAGGYVAGHRWLGG